MLKIDNKLKQKFFSKNYPLKKISPRWKEISYSTGINSMDKIFEIDIASLISGENYKDANEKYVVQGPEDGGMDIVYNDEVNDTWYFIQVKMKDYDRKYIDKMTSQFHTSFQCGNFNDNNKGLKKFVKKYNDKSNKTSKIIYVFVGLEDNKMESGKQAFGNEKNVDIYSYKEFMLKAASKGFKKEINDKFKITIPKLRDNNLKDDDHKGILSIVNAKDLISQFISLNEISVDNLFNKNIRNKVVKNKFKNQLKETIKYYSEYFHFFNNGITIIAEEIDDTKTSGLIIITNPQIINGQQTFRTLLDIYKNGEDLKNIKVPLKIIEENNPEMIKKIARFSNNQTAVTEAELKYTSKEYEEIVNLSKEYGYKLKGKKGERNFDEIVASLVNNGEVNINDLIRAHSSITYPQEYLGTSKNSIAKVVNEYFEIKNDIGETNNKYNSLVKPQNFKKVLKIIEEYKNSYNKRKDFLINKYKEEGKKSKEYNILINKDMNPYKYGVSLFYILYDRYGDNLDMYKALKHVYNNDANKNMNHYKNDKTINESLANIKKNINNFKIKYLYH